MIVLSFNNYLTYKLQKKIIQYMRNSCCSTQKNKNTNNWSIKEITTLQKFTLNELKKKRLKNE